MITRKDDGRVGVSTPLRWQMLGSGYRVYNTALMRFHGPDDVSPFGEGGMNAYAYGAGDPINHSDPSGHFVASLLGTLMAVGALGTGVGALASKASGNEKTAGHLGLIAGVMALGAVAMAASFLFSVAPRPGQLRVQRQRRKDTVHVHGGPHFTDAGNADLDGIGLVEQLRSKGLGNKPIELRSCFGGYGPDSQAQVLANAMGQPVTAYKGRVWSLALTGWVIRGSRDKFYPQNGIAAAGTAIRNRRLNRAP